MIQYVFYFSDSLDKEQMQHVADAAKVCFGDACSVMGYATSGSLFIVDTPTDVEKQMLDGFTASLESSGFSLKAPPVKKNSENEPLIETPTAKSRPSPKQPRRVPLSIFITSLCVVLVLTVLTTFAILHERFGQALLELQDQMWDTPDTTPPTDTLEPLVVPKLYNDLAILQFLFDQYAIEDIDDEALETAVLKAYAAGTGDIYAEYYTSEEIEALDADDQGEMQGIGVSVVNDTVEVNGLSYSVLTVISVYNNSPALAAGVRVGDHVYTVTDTNGEILLVNEIGYDAALACVRGVADTVAEFAVLRNGARGYEVVPFTIKREVFTSESVSKRVLENDPTVGIVKISQFDLTTPEQFKAAMDGLIADGCKKFIFDVRYNPGGKLESIEAILSTLLEEGDVMISTVYKNGVEEVDRVRKVTYTRDGYEGCSVTADDIGKYRGYPFAVLTNEYTASAAELFTSNLRDYDLATLVGKTTFGKGCMQTTFDLSYFGVDGALKLTVAWYQPPSGENYHDVGIAPDIEVGMNKEVLEKYGNIYLIPDVEDAQLMAAVEALQ